MARTTHIARLKTRYEQEIKPELIRRFEYSTPMQAPRIKKITLNMGVGDAKQDSKALEAATEQLATIAGQRPNVRRARKSIAAFKLREGMPVGVSVTLRGERSYEFLDRLMSVAIPRIRDFRGMNPRSFDGRGNYSLGVREQIIFPEIDYDTIDQTRGLDITITTNAATDLEAFVLLEMLGFPFSQEGRPEGAGPPRGVDGGSSNGSTGTDAPAQAEQPQAEVAEEPQPVEEPQAEEPQAEAAEEPQAEVAEEPQAEVAEEPQPAEEPQAEVTEEPQTMPEPEAEAAAPPIVAEPENEGASEDFTGVEEASREPGDVPGAADGEATGRYVEPESGAAQEPSPVDSGEQPAAAVEPSAVAPSGETAPAVSEPESRLAADEEDPVNDVSAQEPDPAAAEDDGAEADEE